MIEPVSLPRRQPKRRGPTIPPLRLRIMGLVFIALVGVGCPCIRSTVNASPGLRWWLFSNFGAQRVCPEMLKRGAPLKLTPNGNTIGRFFPTRCETKIDHPTKTMTLTFGGTGYAWTPIAGRIGFAVDGSVEYRPDFYMAEDAVYVWAKTNRVVSGPTFQVGHVENSMVNWAARTPVGYLANTFGSQIVQSHLTNGFTVVHTDDGDEFTLGILQPPQRPKKPFDTSEGDRFVFANETTEIRNGQVDFLGPFEVADDDQALFLRFRVEGPPVEALIMHRGTGDLWREGLQLGQPLGPPPQPPINGFPINPTGEVRQRIKLPRGQYFVVVDNSSAVGNVNPPWNPLGVVGGGAAVLSYTAELGEDDDEW